jgi:hypothetical protein
VPDVAPARFRPPGPARQPPASLAIPAEFVPVIKGIAGLSRHHWVKAPAHGVILEAARGYVARMPGMTPEMRATATQAMVDRINTRFARHPSPADWRPSTRPGPRQDAVVERRVALRLGPGRSRP